MFRAIHEWEKAGVTTSLFSHSRSLSFAHFLRQCLTHVVFELVVLLSLLPKYWDYRCVLLCPVICMFTYLISYIYLKHYFYGGSYAG